MAGRATKAGITKAHRVRSAYGLGLDGPVPDLLDLAERHLGVPVVMLGTLPDDLAGAYLPHDAKPVIFLNGSDIAPRLRFTLAHEIGHHVFRDDRQEDTYAGLVKGGHWIEVRANAFAAELLMPKPAVEAWDVNQPVTLEQIVALANAFGTSLVMTCIRLETAGLAATEEIAPIRAEIEADLGRHYADAEYEDSISAARRSLPRLPDNNSVLARRLPAEWAANQLGRRSAEVEAALTLVTR